MVVGIVLVIGSVLGIINGVKNNNKTLLIVSVLLLILVVAAWIYFVNNPY